MKLLKGSLKVLSSYSAGVFLFTFFLIAPLSMENNMNTWIAVYSFVFFVFTVIFLYKQMWKLGSVESRLETKENSLANGVLYGLLGFLPFLLIEGVYFSIYPALAAAGRGNVLHAIFRCAFGPMYFIIRFLGYSWYSYVISTVVVPTVAIVGYLAGFSGKSAVDVLKRSGSEEEDFLSD